MPYSDILVEETGAIATVTMNRPEKKNALGVTLREEFRAFLANDIAPFHVVILTGTGDSFCSGMDLTEPKGVDVTWEQWSLMTAIYASEAVFIAAVNGAVRGAGLTLVNACDLAIAAPTATFGIPEIRHGFYGPATGPSTQLAAPKKIVAEMLLTARPISAERAREGALINAVAAQGGLMDEARALAERVAQLDRDALSTCKQALNRIPFDADDRNRGVETAITLNLALGARRAEKREGG
ncbi:MAG: enoyl-CoA hydratase/isomerase family protein [Caulobacterales bacterium]|nr:enoyl-CoA hydratase/isomerase family protein [Caulobacterales bacterium]